MLYIRHPAVGEVIQHELLGINMDRCSVQSASLA